ncbi:hypothetical protein TYRP_015884 [Tyrophagus putrescentiae]|nr:hypothetical protein TYRP_015884 [Tyrophagus putrescentiae]
MTPDGPLNQLHCAHFQLAFTWAYYHLVWKQLAKQQLSDDACACLLAPYQSLTTKTTEKHFTSWKAIFKMLANAQSIPFTVKKIKDGGQQKLKWYETRLVHKVVMTLGTIAEKYLINDSRAKVIPLAKVDPADGAHLSISGWGMRNISSSEETRFLQYGDSVRVVNRSACNSTWHSLIPITERMLCAGSASQAFCHGDSGSGAVSLLNSVPTLVGVVSFGLINCSTTDPQPSVFADVAHLRPWIEANSAK